MPTFVQHRLAALIRAFAPAITRAGSRRDASPGSSVSPPWVSTHSGVSRPPVVCDERRPGVSACGARRGFRSPGVALDVHDRCANGQQLKCLTPWWTAAIDPGKPWRNATNESFDDKFRDECLGLEWFRSRQEAKILIEEWRRHYNEIRPHSSLGNRTPEGVHQPIKPDA